jgi:DNA-binding NarL/FixJ family response regulator
MLSASNTMTRRHQRTPSLTDGWKVHPGLRSIRILLVDDQVIFREAFQAWLTSSPDTEVVGGVGNILDAAHLAVTLDPTLVLTEIGSSQSFSECHGIEGIMEMKSLNPGIKVVVLTAYLSETSVQAALQAGVSGFLEKSGSLQEVRTAIVSVIEGKTYLCAQAAAIVARGCRNRGRSPLELLSPRELETLRCIAEGMKNKDIALRLSISANTVGKHRANLMDKLNLRNVAALTALAIEQGLMEVPAFQNVLATGAGLSGYTSERYDHIYAARDTMK